MMAQRVLLSLLLSAILCGHAFAQGVTAVHPVKPNGTALFPAAFASADNISNQTATAIHGYMMVYDGSAWDRWTGAVTQGGTWNIGTVTTLTGITNPVTVTDGAGALNVIVDSGSVTANAGTNLNTSALLTAAQHDAAFGTAGAADAQVRTVQGIASMTPLQVQSNSANLATEATLGNVLTSSNFAAAFGTAGTADSQVMSVQGIASMTPLTVTATNLDVQIGGSDSLTIGTFPDNEPFNVAQFGGSNVVTGAGAGGAGIPRVTVSNDSTVTANQGTAAATTAGWPVISGTVTRGSAAWTSATGVDTAVSVAVTGYGAVLVVLNQTTTLTAGSINFEYSDDGGATWYAAPGIQQNGPFQLTSYGFQANTKEQFRFNVSGATNFRARLNPVITGSGTVNVGVNVMAMPSTERSIVSQATASNLNAQVQGAAASGATKSGNPVQTGGVFNTTPPTVSNGQAVEAQYTARGEAHTVIRDAAGNIRGVNVTAGNALQQDVTSIAGTAVGTAAAGIQKVGVVGNANGAFDAANNAAAPANVLVEGWETATQTTTQPTAATAGNVRRGVARTDGALYVVPGGPVQWQCNLGGIGTTLTECKAAPGASLRLYITDIVAVSTTTTSGLFTLRFGTGTNCGTGTGNLFFASASATLPNAPNNATGGPGATIMNFTTPIAVTANNAVCVLGVATNTTNIQISGYTAP
jgi:hypothetical protein